MRYKAVVYAILGLTSAGVLAAVILPVFAVSHHYSGPSCLSNIHQLTASMLMYDDDNGALPPAGAWMDEITPLVRRERVFHCPAVYRENRFAYGYAMATQLGGKALRRTPAPEKQPMVFDSFPIGRNAHTLNPIIPGFSRHGGQNIGFADGHAKFLKGKPLR